MIQWYFQALKLYRRWDSPTMRIFSITSKSHQVVEFVVGLLWMLASFAIVLFVKKYLKKTLKTE